MNTVLTNGVRAGDGEAEERAGIHASISLSEIDPLSHGTGKLPLKIDAHGSQLRNSSASHPSIVHIESENMPETVKENIQEAIPETATTSPIEYQDKLYLHLKENLSKVKAYAMEIAKKVPVPDQCTIEGKCFELPTLEKLQVSVTKTKLSKHLSTRTYLWTSSFKIECFFQYLCFFSLREAVPSVDFCLFGSPQMLLSLLSCANLCVSLLPLPSVQKGASKQVLLSGHPENASVRVIKQGSHASH